MANLKAPDMSVCSKKCCCLADDGGKKVYDCHDPCPDFPENLVFEPDSCSCVEDVQCGASVGGNSGGAGTTTNTYSVPAVEGATLRFYYQAYQIPDNFIVSGAASFSTGPTSGGQTVYLPMNGTSRTVTVTVVGPQGTGWTYNLGVICP